MTMRRKEFMDMKIIKREKRLCTCCMEEHEVKTVLVEEKMTFKNVKIVYEATYFGVMRLTYSIWMRNRCRKII